jgi:hypothetical protein
MNSYKEKGYFKPKFGEELKNELKKVKLVDGNLSLTYTYLGYDSIKKVVIPLLQKYENEGLIVKILDLTFNFISLSEFDYLFEFLIQKKTNTINKLLLSNNDGYSDPEDRVVYENREEMISKESKNYLTTLKMLTKLLKAHKNIYVIDLPSFKFEESKAECEWWLEQIERLKNKNKKLVKPEFQKDDFQNICIEFKEDKVDLFGEESDSSGDL